MEGAVDAEELLHRLRAVVKENEVCLAAARAERYMNNNNNDLY